MTRTVNALHLEVAIMDAEEDADQLRCPGVEARSYAWAAARSASRPELPAPTCLLVLGWMSRARAREDVRVHRVSRVWSHDTSCVTVWVDGSTNATSRLARSARPPSSHEPSVNRSARARFARLTSLR